MERRPALRLFHSTYPDFLKKVSSFLLSIISGLLFISAWPDAGFTPLIFVAWIPILFLAEQEKKQHRFFLFALLSMLTWNAGTTWWIWNATAPGAVSAILANSFLMCIPLWSFFIFKRRYGDKIGYLTLMVFWLSFEYIHLNWQLSWPWLTLGNVFSTHTNWIQWYEFTGACGGSLWVLLSNVVIFLLIKSWKASSGIPPLITAITVLLLPGVISYTIHPKDTGITATHNVIIVQPNIDPYTEKYDATSTQAQIRQLISLSEKKLDSNTRLIVWPETALPIPVLQSQLLLGTDYKLVFDFVKRHPHVTLQTGIETYKNYGIEKVTNTARKSEADGSYYDAFNSAVSIKAGEPLQFYNKSKLVPGVESLPDFLLWMGPIFEKFGGTAGGYGHDNEAIAFVTKDDPYITAPIICYESIYGEYVSRYVQKGATLLTIMTNDGWWGNTPGYRQHLDYARLRTIETRKWIARSANTGISAVINSNGDIVERTAWNEATAIKYSIPAETGETFFVRYGPVIYVVALLLMGALFIYHFIIILKNRFERSVRL